MASETNVIRRDFECGCFIITGGVYVDVHDCPDHPAWWDEGAVSVPGRDAMPPIPGRQTRAQEATVSEIDPNEYSKDELVDMAEDAGVEPTGTKADIAEAIVEAEQLRHPRGTPPPGFDPKNPGGESFDYGEVEDAEDEEKTGGMSFDYGATDA